MARKVKLHSLENRYFERMASSLGDKTRLLKFLPSIENPDNPPHVLDVGAGGGEFSRALADLGYQVTALDLSDEALAHISAFRYNNIDTLKALANETHLFGEDKYDAVICSSVFHEVFSYGDSVHKAGHYSSINRALESLHKALKTGGVLILRDGVLPDDGNVIGSFQLQPGHDDSVVEKYLEMCPFANGNVHTDTGHLVKLTRVAPRTWVGNYRSIMEFAYTYTWGLDSYPRETQELYGVYTVAEYANVLTENGFKVTHSESYLQPGYPKFLAEKMTLNAPERNNVWFDSNAIWVAQKN